VRPEPLRAGAVPESQKRFSLKREKSTVKAESQVERQLHLAVKHLRLSQQAKLQIQLTVIIIAERNRS
jgi:hypothetical protein